VTNPVSRQRNSRVCPRRFWVLNLVATGTGASEAITTHSALILVEAPLPAFSSPFGALSGGAWSLLQCLFDQIGSQVAKRSTLLVAALFQCLKGAIRKGHGNSPGTSALVPQGGGRDRRCQSHIPCDTHQVDPFIISSALDQGRIRTMTI
jgi:hypothetical protein